MYGNTSHGSFMWRSSWSEKVTPQSHEWQHPPQCNLRLSDRQRGVRGSAAWTTGTGSVQRGVLGSVRVARGRRAPRWGTHQRGVDASAPHRVVWAGTTCTTLVCEVLKQKQQHQMLSRALISCSLKSFFLMLSSVLWPLEKFHPLQNGNSTTTLLYCVPLRKRYSKP